MLATASRRRYAPAGKRSSVPVGSSRESSSSLRAANHSNPSNSTKNGTANSTGSRIGGGSQFTCASAEAQHVVAPRRAQRAVGIFDHDVVLVEQQRRAVPVP